MAQEIKATIEIPKDMILITKIEYETLIDSDPLGKIRDLNWFCSLVGKDSRWVKPRILENPRFKRKINAENGGFVHYPKFNGDRYQFLEKQAREFIDKNFGLIMKEHVKAAR